ncbi:glycosyltransferase [Glycocaulis profundi]|nr:glycosyltransferase [Glycocaulis profundi]
MTETTPAGGGDAKTLRFSIITPSFNQGRFLPECLDSVARQTHPAHEHIVLDPGSKDDSREIAAKAEGVTLIAEPDDGQVDAINKGFAMATGDVLAWLNSDDVYADETVFEKVAARFAEPDAPDIVYGRAEFMDEDGAFLKKAFVNGNADTLLETLQHQVGIIQPSVFIHRRAFEKVGGLDPDYEYALDYEYWARLAAGGCRWAHLDHLLSRHRWWSDMKTASQRDLSLHEHCRVVLKHFGYVNWRWIHRLADCLVGGVDGIVDSDTSQVDELARRRKIAELYLQYIKPAGVRNSLRRRVREPQVRQTVADMLNHGVDLSPYAFWAEPVQEDSPETAPDGKALPVTWRPLAGSLERGEDVVAYRFSEELDWAFKRSWHDQQMARTRAFCEQLRSARSSDTCVVVGNGPSLKKTPLSALEGTDVFISNFAYYHAELLQRAKFLTITNDYVMRQGAYDLPQLRSVYKLLPVWMAPYTVPQPETFYFSAHLRPQFSDSIEHWVSWRSTVSFFNLQLAAGLGYKKILLVGFDHSYKQQDSLKEGDLIEQRDDDENHFIASYFKGKVWQAADTGNMESVYEIAREHAEKSGIEIVNCTVGGKLEVFRRGRLAAELAR